MDFVPRELREILTDTPELKRAFLVGGCVRDAILGAAHGKDFDVEVFGVDYEALIRGLSRWGRTDLVGRSFGVVKLATTSGHQYDFSIPRRDSKIAPGHKGFRTDFDPGITPKEAAARRDFTVNSLMYDPRQERVMDFFGGTDDLRRGILRHTSAAFAEDPLRVLRGMQFAARLDLRPAPETIALCREIKGRSAELPVERVREEWFKWAQLSRRPSAGLRFLQQTEWLDDYPELKALAATPQEPDWHPEGDVFTHTCHCCDALAGLDGWQKADGESRIVYMLATLAHDFGKPPMTHQTIKDGQMRIVSPGHEEAGVPLAKQFLERFRTPIAIEERVLPLVRHHLFHFQGMTDRAVRRLAKRLEPETIEGLCLVMTADSMGRPPRPAVVPEHVTALLAKAHELEVREKPPAPLLQGRHLIALGLAPGPAMGKILHEAYEAQLEGTIKTHEEALDWAKERIGGKSANPPR